MPHEVGAALVWEVRLEVTHAEDTLITEDMLDALMRAKYVVLCFAIASCIASLVVALNLKKTYQSEVLLQPVIAEHVAGGGGSITSKLGGLGKVAGLGGGERDPTEEALAILQSRQFTTEFIEEKQLLPLLFEGKGRRSDDPPTVLDAYKIFDEKIRTIERDRQSGMIRLVIEWTDPALAASWANELVARVNEHLRQRAIIDSRRSLDFLRKEADVTPVSSLREAVVHLMESELQKVMLATVHKEYAFKIIDPAVKAKKPIKPNRPLIVIVGTVAGALLGCFVALVWQGMKNRRVKYRNIY